MYYSRYSMLYYSKAWNIRLRNSNTKPFHYLIISMCNNPNILIILFSCILDINKTVSHSTCVAVLAKWVWGIQLPLQQHFLGWPVRDTVVYDIKFRARSMTERMIRLAKSLRKFFGIQELFHGRNKKMVLY